PFAPQPHSPSPLQLQHPLLQSPPAAVADKFPAASDYPMTGHHDRHRVRAVGCSDRADGLHSADGLRYLHIAARFAERDRLQMTPDPLLAGCAGHSERDIEPAQLAREISLQLEGEFAHLAMSVIALGIERPRRREVDGTNPGIAGNQLEDEAAVDGDFSPVQHRKYQAIRNLTRH